MKTIIIFLALSFLSVPLSAKICTYDVSKSSIKLKWTGFKTTEKVAVSGTFKSIDWSLKPSNSLSESMKSMKFKIKTSSVDSGNWLRDKRIYKSFFKLMNQGDEILGHGISVDEKNKTAVIEVEMNKERTPVIFSFEQANDNTFKMKGSIDILKHYKMNSSFESIAKLCKALHTGPDGVSKTWTDVDLTIIGKITKLCK